ncbi:MAG TPA: acyl-CoA thioesterase [Bryobacteraceae bacterium]
MSEENGRPVSDSKAEYSALAMPNDANPLGTLFGGRVMSLVDLSASISAHRHARCPVVTASIDHMNFLVPVRIGDLITCYSQVNRVFRTSMEVGVRVMVENLSTGEKKHTSTAYLTFVALDPSGERVTLAQAMPETADERRRFDQALERRQARLELRERARTRQ